MAVNSILKFFLPKDKVFFQLFESVSESVVQMAEKLRELVHEKDFSKIVKKSLFFCTTEIDS